MTITARALIVLALAALTMAACGRAPAPTPVTPPASVVRPAPPEMTSEHKAKEEFDRKPLKRRIAAFLGNTRGAYVIPERSVAMNFFEAVSGALYEQPGSGLLWGWRLHSATEMGAVQMTEDRQIEAVAILHYDCYHEARGRYIDNSCRIDQPMVSVFLPRSPRAAQLIRRMCDWGVAHKGRNVICKTVWITPTPVRAGERHLRSAKRGPRSRPAVAPPLD